MRVLLPGFVLINSSNSNMITPQIFTSELEAEDFAEGYSATNYSIIPAVGSFEYSAVLSQEQQEKGEEAERRLCGGPAI